MSSFSPPHPPGQPISSAVSSVALHSPLSECLPLLPTCQSLWTRGFLRQAPGIPSASVDIDEFTNQFRKMRTSILNCPWAQGTGWQALMKGLNILSHWQCSKWSLGTLGVPWHPFRNLRSQNSFHNNLRQGLAKFFWKGWDKYFRPCRSMVSVTTTQHCWVEQP